MGPRTLWGLLLLLQRWQEDPILAAGDDCGGDRLEGPVSRVPSSGLLAVSSTMEGQGWLIGLAG
jgi:hypothetical protein